MVQGEVGMNYWNLTFAEQSKDDPVERAKAIRGCLEYLAEELDTHELGEAAMMLEAATEAVEEWLDQRDPLWALFSRKPGGEADEA